MTKKKIIGLAAAMFGISMAANATVTNIIPSDWGIYKGNWAHCSLLPLDQYSIPDPADSTKQMALAQRLYDGEESDKKPLALEIDAKEKGGYYAITVYAAANATGKQKGSPVTDGDTSAAKFKVYSWNEGRESSTMGHYVAYGDNTTAEVPIVSNVTGTITKLKKYTLFFTPPAKEIDRPSRYVRIGIELNNTTSTNWYVIQVASLKKLEKDKIYEGTELYTAWQEATANYNNCSATDAAKTAYKTAIDAAYTYMTTNLKTVDQANAGAKAIAEQIGKLNDALKAFVMAGARPAEGHRFDLSFMIKNAKMANNDSTGWTMTARPNAIYSNVVEYWNQNFSYSQTVDSLPAGKYILKAQAYQRYGTNEKCVEDYNSSANGDVNYNVKTILFAGKNQTAVKNMASEGREVVTLHGNNALYTNNGKNYPDDVNAASDYFDVGCYDNELSFMKSDDKAIDLGIKSDDNGDYGKNSMFTNFRLYMEGLSVGAMVIDEDVKDPTLPRNVSNVTVTVKRKFVKGWNSLCVPVKITSAQLKETLGDNLTHVAEYVEVKRTSAKTLRLNFRELADNDTITAGTSVMVKFDAAVDSKVYDFGLVPVRNIAERPVDVKKVTEDDSISVCFRGSYYMDDFPSRHYQFAEISGTEVVNHRQASNSDPVYPSHALFYILKDKSNYLNAVTETNLKYIGAAIGTMTIDEDVKDPTLPRNVSYINVTVKRKFVEGWNSLCVPVKIPSAKLKEMLGKPSKMAAFDEVVRTSDKTMKLNFRELTDNDTITAGTSVMVKFDAAVDSKAYTFELVPVNEVAERPVDVKKVTADDSISVCFRGSYFMDDFPSRHYQFVEISGTEVVNHRQASNSDPVYPSHALFYILKDKSKYLNVVNETNLDGVKTGIKGISIAEDDGTIVSGAIYDLQGRRVSNPSAGGVYIVNGKKVVM